jgi:hypothetical protein
MPIALIVFLLVIGGTALVGIAGYAIDRTTARQEERKQ